MTRGGEGRGQKHKSGAGSAPTQHIRCRVGGTGYYAPTPDRVWPAAAAQVDAGFQRRRQPDIPGHDQDQPPLPANPRQIPAEQRPCRVMVMAQNDSRLAARQPRNRGTRVRKPLVVGKQPQPRQGAGRATQTPVEELQVQGNWGEPRRIADNRTRLECLQDALADDTARGSVRTTRRSRSRLAAERWTMLDPGASVV